MWRSGGDIPLIPKLNTIWTERPVSCPGRFTTGCKETPGVLYVEGFEWTHSRFGLRYPACYQVALQLDVCDQREV
jgi:hypothetical protein